MWGQVALTDHVAQILEGVAGHQGLVRVRAEAHGRQHVQHRGYIPQVVLL